MYIKSGGEITTKEFRESMKVDNLDDFDLSEVLDDYSDFEGELVFSDNEEGE